MQDINWLQVTNRQAGPDSAGYVPSPTPSPAPGHSQSLHSAIRTAAAPSAAQACSCHD